MAATRIRTSAIQLQAHDRSDFAERWPAIKQTVHKAARDSQLVVLPEATVPGYVLGSGAVDERQLAAALADICAVAAETGSVIVYGSARRDGTKLYNSAYVIDRGRVAGIVDKQFLWHFDRRWFAQGAPAWPIPTSLGTLGVLICADGRIPTIPRLLVERGAQALVMPTAWVTSGRDPANRENVQADLLARVRARENSVGFVAANKVGTEMACVAYCGKSQVVDPFGEATVASETEAQVVQAEIVMQEPRFEASGPVAAPREQPLPRQARILLACDEEFSIERAAMLDADLLLRPRSGTVLGTPCPFVRVRDDAMCDPKALIPIKFAGHGLVVWDSALPSPWQVRFARARAVELRLYVAVFDAPNARAYAVDPDGSLVCGTLAGYDAASFALNAGRVNETLVAPATDIIAGLRAAMREPRGHGPALQRS